MTEVQLTLFLPTLAYEVILPLTSEQTLFITVIVK